MLDINKPIDVSNFIFCNDLFSEPIQIKTNAGELKNRKIKELLARIGQDHKLSLFSKRPLLVEGPSDSIICSGIDRVLDLYIEAAGVQILPVIGKGEIPVVIKFMRLIGKDPIVLTDADSFTDGLDLIYAFTNSEFADILAQGKGFCNGNTLAKTIYNDFCKVVDTSWDFFIPYIENNYYWINRNNDDDNAKIQRRVYFSLLFSDIDEINKIIENNTEINAIKVR